MPYLRLTSIICEEPEETDKDEIYLKLKGQKIWPRDKRFAKIDVDESLPVRIRLQLDKPLKLVLELWEYDLTSRDDHLGDFILDVTNLQPARFTELLIPNKKLRKQPSYLLNWEIKN